MLLYLLIIIVICFLTIYLYNYQQRVQDHIQKTENNKYNLGNLF